MSLVNQHCWTMEIPWADVTSPMLIPRHKRKCSFWTEMICRIFCPTSSRKLVSGSNNMRSMQFFLRNSHLSPQRLIDSFTWESKEIQKGKNKIYPSARRPERTLTARADITDSRQQVLSSLTEKASPDCVSKICFFDRHH